MTENVAKKIFLNRKNVIFLLLTALWLALAIFAVSKHEFWRDEVRDLSIARSVASPFELVEEKKKEASAWL